MSTSNVTGGIANATASFSQAQTTGFLAGNTYPIPAIRLQHSVKPGTLADQLDGIAPILLTLAPNTPQVVDLLAMVDAFNSPITPARINFVAIKIVAGPDGSVLKVGGAGANEFDGLASAGATINVYPPTTLNDGFAVFSAPAATGMLVSPTAHLLKFDSGTAALTVQVLIGTRSA